MTRAGRAAFGSLLLIVLPGLGLAQTAGDWCNVDRWGSETRGIEWNRMFRQTYEELRKNEPGTAAKSAKRARKLLGRLLDAFVSGPSGTRFVGLTTYLLAVAEQRQGKSDDAAWHFQMAQNFAPELEVAFGDFEDVTEFFRKHLLSAQPSPGSSEKGRVPLAGELPPDVDPAKLSAVSPPQLTHKVLPTYPLGAREARLDGVTLVRTYIDRNGIPRAPTIKQGCGVTVFDVAALEAIGQWRYRPAMLAGRPVAVWNTITVNFHLQR